MVSKSAVKLVVGSNFFVTALAILRSADPGLLHNCSACGSGAVFLRKGDSSHSPSFSIDVGLHYGAAYQQQHSMQINLICSAGKDCTAFDHRLAPSGVAALIICPCFSRPFSSVSLLASSAFWVALLAADTNDFLFRFGSSARAPLTTTEALNFFLESMRSCCRPFSAKYRTQGCWDISSWL